MMFYGMGAAIAVRVSNFKGQNDMVNVRRSAYAGYHLILAMAVVLLSIVFLLRNQVGGWFTDSVEVSAMVSSLFLPFLVYQFGDGLQISFANALRGIADVKPMMFIAFISFINSVLISGFIRFSVLLPFFYPFLRGYFLSLRRGRQSDCLTFFGLCFFPFCDFSSFKFVSNHSEPCGLSRTVSRKRRLPYSHDTCSQYKLPL